MTAPLWWGVLGDLRNTVLLPYYEIMKFGGAIPSIVLLSRLHNIKSIDCNVMCRSTINEATLMCSKTLGIRKASDINMPNEQTTT